MTDETFPPGCVKRPLGRSWVLSQFANSVLSFVTVGLLITIPHSSPPSYPLILPPFRPSHFCNRRNGGFRRLVLSFSLPVPFRASSPSFLVARARAHATHFTLAHFAGKGARLIKTFIFNCDFNCFPFAPRPPPTRFLALHRSDISSSGDQEMSFKCAI